MKNPPTKSVEIIVKSSGVKKFRVSQEKARGLLLLLNEFAVSGSEEETLSSEDVFRDLESEFGRSGAALQGARLKEELTQVELAKKLGIEQGDLSKMEHGKRSISKKMAKKIALILKVDYRIFL